MSRLSLRTKVLYSSGDLTVAVTMSIVSFFQLYFLTDVAGLAPALAGWALLVGKLWDAVNDPLVGVLADRISHRMGRRRILLLVGAVPLGLGYFMMWIVPPFSDIGLAIYYALAIIVFDSAYTLVHIGYNALTPSLTKDYDERSSLNGIRMAYQLLGSMGAIIGFTVIGWYALDARSMYAQMGLVMGIIAIAPVFVVLSVTREFKEEKAGDMGVMQSLSATLGSKPFRRFIGLYLLSWTTASIMSAILVYFTNYYLRVPEQANYIVLTAQGSAVLFIPAVVRLCKRTDKRMAFVIGSAAWIVAMVGISLLPQGAVGAAYFLAAACGFGIATAYVVPWAMLPDIIEHDQAITGQRREGAFYSFSAFFQKLGTAAALWLMGIVLDASGYLTPAAGETVLQPSSAVLAIRWFMGPVPAILLIGSIMIALRYPITRRDHEERLAALAARAD